MAITAGNDILAADFITTSTGAGDAGKGIRLDSAGKIDSVNEKAPSEGAFTAGETINGATLPVAVYQDTADNEFKVCDANDIAKLQFIGFAVSNSTDGNSIDIQFNGIVSGFTGLSEGEKYYIQDDGTIGTSMGTYEVLVGIAISTTELLIQKGSFEYIGTETDTADVFTPPAIARYAVIKFETLHNVAPIGNIDSEFFISKVGKTTGQIEGIVAVREEYNDQYRITITISWSGANITLSVSTNIGSVSISGTAYYYK